MNHLKNIISLFILTFTSHLFAQGPPAAAQKESVLIVGATTHTGEGNVIENSAVGFNNGKITFVGNLSSVNKSDYKEVINASGQHLYPGFIAPNAVLGLTEVNAVRATRDFSEVGEFNPHVRSLVAYNAESKLIPVTRRNGILLAQATPRGSLITGSSSVVVLDAWNWEDAAYKKDLGIHINWPNAFSRRGFRSEARYQANKNYNKQVAKIHSYFDETKAQMHNNSSPKNLKYEALKGVFNGEKSVFVEASEQQEIMDAIALKKKYKIAHLTIVGGYDAYKVMDALKENNVSVLLQEVHSLPQLEGDDIRLPFKLPKILIENGILVGLYSSNAMQLRNLPFYAGTVAGQGLDKEKALQLLTSQTAKILGIDATTGSISLGKDATLFISKGDALDMMGNQLTRAFIQGREIDLNTHQVELYKRYMKKYNPTK